MTRLALAAAWLVLAGLTQQGSSPVPLKDDDLVFVDNNPATTTGLYHRQGCIWAARAWPTKITLKEAKSRYFQAHCECVKGVKVPPPCPEVIPTQPATVQPSVGSSSVVESTAPSTPSNVVPATTPRPAAAPAPARQQCAATTKKGTRCARLAAVGSAFCWQHGG
jgi:hypothetical protein